MELQTLAGKVWRGIHTDKHLVVIDLDNKKGIDEFIEHCFPNLKTLEGLSRQTIVEQHSDNREKTHVYFIVEKPLTNRGSINGANRNDDSNPIIEIKSEGKSFVICYPSVHKNGYRYEIIGTKAPMVLDWKQSEQLQENINKIYKKYGETETKDNNGLTPISNLLKEDYVSHEGSRHSDLLRIMESYIQRYKEDLDLDEIKKIGRDWNQIHCQPSLEDKEVDRQWKSALKFITTAITNISTESILENKRYITKKINDNPEVYYYADKMEKKIGRFKIVIMDDKETGQKKEKTIFSNIIIDAVPKRIYVYDNNPLLEKSLERIKIIFESATYEKLLEVGPHDNMDAIIRELEHRHLVIHKKTS